MVQIPYTLKVRGKGINADYEKILTSEKSTSETRKEIRRIFQQANRRIQNIEKSKALSPALNALKQQRNLEQGFSKFSISKLTDWNDIKIAYSQAIEFLRNETSTASGAKRFEREILRANRVEIKNEYLDVIRRYYANEFLTARERNYIENYLAKYTDVLIEFETAFKNAENQMLTASDKLQNLNDLMQAANKDVEKQNIDGINNIVAKFDFFKYD